MPDPVIELRGARKTYDATVAVHGLDLAVPAGSSYALLGPNGSGKTTTIRMILRIQEPDAGEVRLFGGPPSTDALERVGHLPEERGLYPRMTALDALVFLAELKGIRRREGRRRVREWLDRVGLGERANDQIQGLSKGMQQKLQFVAAVAHDPEVVILDEPFSGLDPFNQQALREILGDLRRKGRTILFSTHIIEHAERLCDHVCILARGRAVVRGPLAVVKREHGERYVALDVERWTAEIEAAVRTAPGVGEVRHDGTAFEIRLADGAAPEPLLRHLIGRDVPVHRFEVVEPSLHQVFLERVGALPLEMEPGPDV